MSNNYTLTLKIMQVKFAFFRIFFDWLNFGHENTAIFLGLSPQIALPGRHFGGACVWSKPTIPDAVMRI